MIENDRYCKENINELRSILYDINLLKFKN